MHAIELGLILAELDIGPDLARCSLNLAELGQCWPSCLAKRCGSIEVGHPAWTQFEIATSWGLHKNHILPDHLWSSLEHAVVSQKLRGTAKHI